MFLYGSPSVARGNKKPSIGIPKRAGSRAVRLVAQRPHPLAGTTLPGAAGWRGRCPALDVDNRLTQPTEEINKRPLSRSSGPRELRAGREGGRCQGRRAAGASAVVALDAVALSMSPAVSSMGVGILRVLLARKRPAPGAGGNRAGLDPRAAGRSVYLGDATAPMRQRSMRREVT